MKKARRTLAFLLAAVMFCGSFGVFTSLFTQAEPEITAPITNGDTGSSQTGVSSAYAIVQGPAEMTLGWEKITSLDNLVQYGKDGKDGIYIGHKDGFYFKSTTYNVNNSARTGIEKTKPAKNHPNAENAERATKYFLEFVEGTNYQFKAYCIVDGTQKYITQSGDSLNLTEQKAEASDFTVEVHTSNDTTFRVTDGSGYYWNMQGGDGGTGFAAYNNKTDGNAKLYFWREVPVPEDPYGLAKKTYGLMSWNGGTTARAIMANAIDNDALQAMPLTVMSKSASGKDEDMLFVANNSSISLWTFEWINNGEYYIKYGTQYLQISSSGLSLVGDRNSASEITVVPGTGAHAGEICLKSGNTTLTYSGTVAEGFKVGGAVGSEWLRLVGESELTNEYLMTPSASKISVSDTDKVTEGTRGIVVYVRHWNEDKKRYDFYAINSTGELVPCYESGDSIQWRGGRVNDMLWNFVEYYWEGTTDPNYYYELYSPYSQKYIAPQVTGGQILSDNTIGINLIGRRNGAYYTTIVAWDDDNYSYAGLKVEGNQIVSCPISEADDFYFAISNVIPVDDKLHTVETVDHKQYGITMKLVDFDKDYMDAFLGSDKGGAVTYTVSGLLSTNLGNDGYPMTTGKDTSYKNKANFTSKSLSEFFEGAQEVNHLFVTSTYSASGYYEYDSTQNFASLDKDTGNFTVYQEIGTMDADNRITLQHGQFMPYNDIEAGYFSSVNPKNLYSATAKELPNDDPRKGEQLYLVKDPDYYFGVEIEASFTQSVNGHDSWGHDIIYEFTGDDDFWLYVDGELIIDLGGIHSALAGTVNYSTGEVVVNGVKKTLPEIFEENYKARNTGASEEDVNKYLAQYFDEGQTIFKDYTTHTMRIFYLERGAGASNLHMRFNLASIKPGTVELSKELSGIDNTESVLAEFPYQIYYQIRESKESDTLITQLLSQKGDNKKDENTDNTDNNDNDENSEVDRIYVYYKDTIRPVTFRDHIDIDGVTYNNVFMVKAGETIEIDLPDGTEKYTIVECGVNPNIYDEVSVNGVKIEGTSPMNRKYDNINSGVESDSTTPLSRLDYALQWASTKDRARVAYVNHVDPKALSTLTIKKTLYDETGDTELEYGKTDDSTFSFRVSFDTEFVKGELTLANMYTYHVKDPDGYYCTWDATTQKFRATTHTDYGDDGLDKASVSFTTAIYGSISKIPAGYTVEFRNLLAGTQFQVVERPSEIPDGYSFQKYNYSKGNDNTIVISYNASNGVTDTIGADDSPEVEVCNLRGYGFRVNKVWTDADYMSERASTYFALFYKDENGELKLVGDSLKELPYNASAQTLYWYYLQLPVENVAFEKYCIREVEVTNPRYDENGVLMYDSITPIEHSGNLPLKGKLKGETQNAELTYTVLYTKTERTNQSHLLIQDVTNNRPGIELRKTNWSGDWSGGGGLANATFVLKDAEGYTIGTFTSNVDGLITVAFLRDNVNYTLEEIKAPNGYYGLQRPMTLRLNQGTVTVSVLDKEDKEYYQLTQGGGTTPELVIKNRPIDFVVRKEDSDTEEALEGVEFSFLQYLVDSNNNGDYFTIPGYASVKTNATGDIEQLDLQLLRGQYQLREIKALDGYKPLTEYININVEDTGAIVPNGTLPNGVELKDDKKEDGTIVYTLVIPNHVIDCTLTIERTDGKDDQDFWYTVTDNKTGKSIEVVIPAGEDKVTVSGIVVRPGVTYIVTEHGDWSWRYESKVGDVTNNVYVKDDNGVAIVTPYRNDGKNGNNSIDITVPFAGNRNDNEYLGGYNREVNVFSSLNNNGGHTEVTD